jgi:putative transposase
MPRTARADEGGLVYHVLNRGNGRATVFLDDEDYASFVELIGKACERLPMRVPGFCLMPTHFHLALRPHKDGDLGRWMQWLMTSHVRRFHRKYGGSGHVWQGRFKAFPVAGDEHLLTVLRYMERTPLREGLVDDAKAWPWSSLTLLPARKRPVWLVDDAAPRHAGWTRLVNRPQTAAEEEAVLRSIVRGAPFGPDAWTKRVVKRLGLEHTLRPRGRPRLEQPGRAKK